MSSVSTTIYLEEIIHPLKFKNVTVDVEAFSWMKDPFTETLLTTNDPQTYLSMLMHVSQHTHERYKVRAIVASALCKNLVARAELVCISFINLYCANRNIQFAIDTFPAQNSSTRVWESIAAIAKKRIVEWMLYYTIKDMYYSNTVWTPFRDKQIAQRFGMHINSKLTKVVMSGNNICSLSIAPYFCAQRYSQQFGINTTADNLFQNLHDTFFGTKCAIDNQFSCKYTATTILDYLGIETPKANTLRYILSDSLRCMIETSISTHFYSQDMTMPRIITKIANAALFTFHPQGARRLSQRLNGFDWESEAAQTIASNAFHVHNVFDFTHLENYESVHDKCGGYICAKYENRTHFIECVGCGVWIHGFSTNNCLVMMGKKSTHFLVLCRNCMLKPGVWCSPETLTEYNCSVFVAQTRDIELCMCPRDDELNTKYMMFVSGIKKSSAKVRAQFFAPIKKIINDA